MISLPQLKKVVRFDSGPAIAESRRKIDGYGICDGIVDSGLVSELSATGRLRGVCIPTHL